ncbi:ABC transporter ATP-binding protein [Paenibacillus sp. CF384]|uniref:ABC transporter ATP-binding protein n=1 Tax=Paenibacillus sp. CF384 TaxID=1884382 RepID=UPI00089D7945|nr:ATP-binding cassette domain-containing protein [Paenibacillus sp. CF384]SDX92609.1 energy-coupling factor transport system ATP-binding protein [Paenibacillus sp. CF384]
MADSRSVINVQQLVFCYPGAEAPSLTGLNVQVEQGEFVAIIGSNGSGKSSLCKALTGLIPHYYTGDMEGSVHVAGLDTRQASVSSLAYKVGYVSQDFENQLVRPTVRQEVEFAPMNFGHLDYEMQATRTMEKLGIAHLSDRYIWQLSGGQKHIAALAAVLSLDPEILIVDEPAAELDPFHAETVYATLRKLNENEGKTIVVIEHHTEWIANYCDSVILVADGRVVWKKPTAEALSCVEELRAHQIFPPQVTQIGERLGLRLDTSLYPVTLEEGIEALKRRSSASVSSEPAAALATPTLHKVEAASAVQLSDITFSYPTMNKIPHTVFRSLNLTIQPGERVALVGGNGAGKSTLLRMMTGLIKPSGGEVSLFGHTVKRPEDAAGRAAYIYQKPESMFISDNVRDEISYFGRARRLPDADAFADLLIDRLHLRELQSRDARLLSGGQQRRVSLAIGLSMKPKVLLLDEPTASLDVVSRKEMIALLEQIGSEVESIVTATHDMQLVAEWADRVIVLHQGRIAADLSPAELFSDRDALARFGLRPPQTVELSHALGFLQPRLTIDRFVAAFAADGNPDGNANTREEAHIGVTH